MVTCGRILTPVCGLGRADTLLLQEFAQRFNAARAIAELVMLAILSFVSYDATDLGRIARDCRQSVLGTPAADGIDNFACNDNDGPAVKNMARRVLEVESWRVYQQILKLRSSAYNGMRLISFSQSM